MKIFAIILGIFPLIGAGICVAKDRLHSPNELSTAIAPSGPIQMRGTLVCLPHKNPEGPQTLECAYGLKDEQGRYFALKDSDPGYKNIGSVPMNATVTVEGSFTEETSAIYPTIVIIEVAKIAILGPSRTGTLLPSKPITNFEECVRAGNPVGESYPRQCWTKDGKHFVESTGEIGGTMPR
jgi:hypothetical protein